MYIDGWAMCCSIFSLWMCPHSNKIHNNLCARHYHTDPNSPAKLQTPLPMFHYLSSWCDTVTSSGNIWSSCQQFCRLICKVQLWFPPFVSWHFKCSPPLHSNCCSACNLQHFSSLLAPHLHPHVINCSEGLYLSLFPLSLWHAVMNTAINLHAPQTANIS
jgi:hypothetical protein